MNDNSAFRRVAAISAIISGLLMLAANVVTSIAVEFRFEFLADPAGLLTAALDQRARTLFRWGEIMGLFGYCLLFIPVMLYLYYWLRLRNPELTALYTVFGLSSIIFCVIEYGVRISIWPALMVAYLQAADAQREVLAAVFTAMTDFTFEGLYGISSILAGLWYLGIGWLLQVERRMLGMVAVIFGIASVGAGVGWLMRIGPLARMDSIFFFVPFWVLWLGIVIWRNAERSEHAVTESTAT